MEHPARAWRTAQRLSVLSAGLGLSLVLGGCNETAETPRLNAEVPVPHQDQAGTQPTRASVALASLSGVPDHVADRMSLAFAKEAGAREIPIAAPDKADYLVRGYVNAYPTEVGTAIAFVLDIFDTAKRRAQRLGDMFVVEGQAADPASVIDSATLAKVAARSTDELASFLRNLASGTAERDSKPDPRAPALAASREDAVAIPATTAAGPGPAPASPGEGTVPR